MNKRVLVGSLMVMCSLAYAQIYKWTDSQGVIHFSDHPHEGSEKIKIPDAQTYSPPVVPTGSAPQEETPVKKEHQYTKIAITQPENEATIWNNQGYMVVAVVVEPDLSPGDNAQLIFDGAPVGDPQATLLFQMNGVYRGSHTLAVQIVNANGDVLGKSETITVFMHRPRVGMVKRQAGGN